MRYLIIDNNVIVNIVEADSDYALGKGWEAAPEGVGIGWSRSAPGQPWVQGPDTVPAAPVPESVTRAQGKAALINAGLWPAVLAYVESIEDPMQQALAEVALNDTLEWRRDSPFLSACAAGMGLTSEQLDELFIDAKQITL